MLFSMYSKIVFGAQVTALEEQLATAQASIAALTAERDKLKETAAQLTVNGEGGAPVLQQQVAELTYARDYYYYQMLEKDKLLQVLLPAMSALLSINPFPPIVPIWHRLVKLSILI